MFLKGLASQQLQSVFQERVEGNPLVGSTMNFDLRAVPGGCSAHALCTCILCLHNGLLHVYIACWCIVYACRHVVCAYVMLAFCACMLVCCACIYIVHACWHGLFNECYRHVINIVHLTQITSPPPIPTPPPPLRGNKDIMNPSERLVWC